MSKGDIRESVFLPDMSKGDIRESVFLPEMGGAGEDAPSYQT